jgi:hypothetical protein
MSERRKGHSERDGRGSDPQTWRSETWEDLELDFDSDRVSPTSEGEAWISKIPEEPWIVGLLRLVERRDGWVGTEEWLFEELRAYAGDRVYRSSDFPRSLDELHEYIVLARGVFGKLDLDLLDYRDLSGDSLKYWHEEVTYLPGASGWGPETPLLVCRRSRIPAVEYYWALGKVLKHWDPFPLSLLLFTESDDNFGCAGRWIGPSFVLVNILRMHYPTFDNVPFEIVNLASPPGARGCLPHYESIHEYGRLFELLPTDDYSAFHEQMLASTPILREVGVRVRQVDRSQEPGGDDHTDLSRTEWIIEAPRWDNPDLF